jgi:cyclopropane fatty-acyl-phospholipid synthase-like methyltransferase
LGERGITNFVPVSVERYKTAIPATLDLFFSIVVMQHLTRDLVYDYFETLGAKLKPGGLAIVQFLEDLEPGPANVDAELKVYEPSVTWTIRQLHDLSRRSGLTFKEVRTYQVTPTALWHWVCFSKPAS